MFKNKLLINLFVGFVKVTGALPALIFFKPRVIRQCKKLPKPCILVSNHKSLMDFALYLIVFSLRTIRFLMAEVLFNKGALFSKFLFALGGIKVNRDAFSFDFIGNCIEVLDNSGTLGIFPEGRLPVGGKPWPFTVSTAFIASHSNALIVPVYTDGNYGIKKRAGVAIGEPFDLLKFKIEGLSEEEQLNHLTKVLEEKVYSLKPLLDEGKGKDAK